MLVCLRLLPQLSCVPTELSLAFQDRIDPVFIYQMELLYVSHILAS